MSSVVAQVGTAPSPSKKTAPPPSFKRPTRTLVTRLQGAFFVVFLAACGLYICWLILPIFLVLLLVDVSLAQRVLDYFVAAFLSLPSALLETYGTRLVSYGPPIPPAHRGEFAVLLSNHPTTADWMYLWPYLFRYGDLTQLKIVMKGNLRPAPIIGWALQLACHLFLARDWQRDQRHVQRLIHHYRTAMRPPSPLTSALFRYIGAPSLQLLLFPEGTNLCPETSARSNAYAAKHGDPAYTHVLHPRTTGFTYIMHELTARDDGDAHTPAQRLAAVYDLTVCFPGTRIADIGEMFQGYFPSVIAVHCRRFPVSELPGDEAGLTQWLQGRYKEKEALLGRVYGGEGAKALGPAVREEGWQVWLALRLVLVGWAVFAALMTVMMVQVGWVKWYALASSLAFVALGYAGGGDGLVLAIEEWRQRGTHHQRRERKPVKGQ